MAITTGDSLPGAALLKLGEEGPETVRLEEKLKGRKVAIFAVPGAFTGVCTTAHMPSFIRTREQFAEKGVADVLCICVNDPFVAQAWAETTGASEAGIEVLADPEGAYTAAIGMDFTAAAAGLIGRSRRYAMLVDDGRVTALHVEESPGTCEATAGEALLAEL
ncbi:peroxiredoxin [Roseicyclus sp. F158]|uniref:Glutathione-dependent peroxiredoxin n=1 Tax=Tropicimonas omnivorans TaxID=3075590 RepID=A0ABU3DCC7_9RHOB|nr:peroxiredoxin [Roseicyclus sp. F158]MDT0681365.1 peroxiredoxin [Roseicyclus sp. F158]